MKKVTKAVIPAAGLGTRVLPATKAMPKGMLPIVDKPAIQYLVEEAVRSGITDILIILGRNQSVIEDHFDRSPELEEKLAAPGKEKMLEECLGISNLANIYFVRQKQTLGLGHAVSMAKPFTGDDPFVVIYGDDVIWGEDPVCAQLIRAYEEFGRPVAGVSAVPWADVSRYCSLKTTPIHDNYFFVDDMIEKPKKGQEFSNYSILGRVLLTPEIYDILANTKPGAGGEIQLAADFAAAVICPDVAILAVSDFIGGETEHQLNIRAADLMAPPVGERLEIRRRIADLPINLRADVINPAVFDPRHRIRIRRGIVLKAVCSTAGERIGAPIAPNARRADAKAAARLHGVLVHRGVYRLHKLIDIVAPPVRERQIAAGRLIGRGIVKLCGRIKIIVELDAVHGVFADNLRHAVTDELANLCDAGVEIIAAVT